MKATILMTALALTACVDTDIPTDGDPALSPVIMTLPSRLFVASEAGLAARVSIIDRTPVIGATVAVASEVSTSVTACIDDRCSEAFVCGACAVPIRIPVRAYESSDALIIVANGHGVRVNGAIVALRPGPDPL